VPGEHAEVADSLADLIVSIDALKELLETRRGEMIDRALPEEWSEQLVPPDALQRGDCVVGSADDDDDLSVPDERYGRDQLLRGIGAPHS